MSAYMSYFVLHITSPDASLILFDSTQKFNEWLDHMVDTSMVPSLMVYPEGEIANSHKHITCRDTPLYHVLNPINNDIPDIKDYSPSYISRSL